MIIVEVTASVLYTCHLTEDDSEKVKEFAEENDCDWETAIYELYSTGELDLYHNSTESDFSTECIESAHEDRLIRGQMSLW